MTSTDYVEGASFTVPFKVLATAIVVALAVGAGLLAREPEWATLPASVGGLALLLAGMVVYGWGGIIWSRTSIDGTCIRQRWLWSREVRLADITQVRLIHLRGLAWVVAPRLTVRAGGLRVHTFNAAGPELLEAFRRLAYGAD